MLYTELRLMMRNLGVREGALLTRSINQTALCAQRIITRLHAEAFGQSDRHEQPANGAAWALVTPRRQEVTSTHPTNQSNFGHRAFWLGVGRDVAGGCF